MATFRRDPARIVTRYHRRHPRRCACEGAGFCNHETARRMSLEETWRVVDDFVWKVRVGVQLNVTNPEDPLYVDPHYYCCLVKKIIVEDRGHLDKISDLIAGLDQNFVIRRCFFTFLLARGRIQLRSGLHRRLAAPAA